MKLKEQIQAEPAIEQYIGNYYFLLDSTRSHISVFKKIYDIKGQEYLTMVGHYDKVPSSYYYGSNNTEVYLILMSLVFPNVKEKT